MTQRTIHEVSLVAALILVSLILSGIWQILSWSGVAWSVVALCAVVCIGYMAYVVLSLEIGYYTAGQNREALREPSGQPHSIRALLHTLTLRHR
ncbi:MAG TPA: hypothetical protein VFI95_05555 [Terriglobales bacterium]|nr:hypothetical protein [Terriglobales bacterium]